MKSYFDNSTERNLATGWRTFSVIIAFFFIILIFIAMPCLLLCTVQKHIYRSSRFEDIRAGIRKRKFYLFFYLLTFMGMRYFLALICVFLHPIPASWLFLFAVIIFTCTNTLFLGECSLKVETFLLDCVLILIAIYTICLAYGV
jgi:hypothetical protein